MILQQAWSVCLIDRITFKSGAENGKGFSGNYGNKKEICKRFNKGKCTQGYRCHYDHRCLNCGKFGHGAHICRANKNNESPGHSGTQVDQG